MNPMKTLHLTDSCSPAATSFLPADYVQAKEQRRTNLICLSLFSLVLATVILAFLVTDRQRQEARRLQHQTDQAYTLAAERLDQMDTLQQQKKQLLRKAQVTAQLLEKVPRSRILGELTNALPSGCGLLELSLETKTLKVSPPAAATAMEQARQAAQAKKKEAAEDQMIQDVSLKLIGSAATDVQVAQLLARLSSNPLFRQVTLSYSEQKTIDDRSVRKFQLDMKIDTSLAPSVPGPEQETHP